MLLSQHSRAHTTFTCAKNYKTFAHLIRYFSVSGLRGFFSSLDLRSSNSFCRVVFQNTVNRTMGFSARHFIRYLIFNVTIENTTQNIVTIQNLVTILLS